MSNHPRFPALRWLPMQQFYPPKHWITALATWFLRLLFGMGVRSRQPQRGFILPTTVMMVLVVSLAVGAITLRSYERTDQVMRSRQQQTIHNITTPALDRAKAKFEYLFQRDPRFPSGIPSETVMNGLLMDGRNLLPGVADAYVFDGESRLDINDDGILDPAWSYREDSDGDGVADTTIAYSIILQTPRASDPFQMTDSSDAAQAGRARVLQVRNAPLSGSQGLVASCQLNDVAVPLEQGWFRDTSSSAILRKNLQVNVYAMPDDPTQTAATLEFQQDRQLEQGNKWGAWFRGDIDLSPGPQFNWNGAMHTEGNLLAARTGSSNRRFTGYLVSSPESCIYTADASEITVANIEANAEQGIPEFRGQVIGSKGYLTTFGDDESLFHLFDASGPITGDDSNVLLDRSRDSVKDDAGYGPSDYTLDPLLLATEGISKTRDASIDYEQAYDQDTWESNPINEQRRIYAQSEKPPYLDDFFRADDRYGPNPRYGDIAIPGNIGQPITGNLISAGGFSDDDLTRESSPSDSEADVGLDGYWERRAHQNGLRLITGQRVELGDAFGWGGLDPSGQLRNAMEEPLNPWDGCEGSNNSNRCNEARHRLTLRDNLAAVQATAVYHTSAGTANNDIPIACLATTVHPGTPATLTDSTTFRNMAAGFESFWTGTWFDSKPLVSDFLTGEGTNGWEYGVHPDTALDDNSDVTIQVLKNLAYYAGDPKGGAPSFTPIQDDTVHPFPEMAMWGDMSVLRRIFDELWSGGYNSLSIADKATLRSAACTIGMLAYNVGYLDNLDYTQDSTNQLTDLSNAIGSASGPPEQIVDGLTGSDKALAKLIMLKEQVERDRLYGFQVGSGAGAGGSTTDVIDDFESRDRRGGQNWVSSEWLRYTTPGQNGSTSDVSIRNDNGSYALRLKDDGVGARRSADLSAMTDPILDFDYRRRRLDNSNDYVTVQLYVSGSPPIDVTPRISGPTNDNSYQAFPSVRIADYIPNFASFSEVSIRFLTSNSLGNGDHVFIDNVRISDAGGTGVTGSAIENKVTDQCFTWQNDGDALASLCTDYPKYPILNALFPFTTHDEVAELPTNDMATRDDTLAAYIQSVNPDSSIQYTAVDLKQTSTLDALALDPKEDIDAWILPHGTPSNSTPNPNANRDILIACVDAICGSGTGTKVVEVPFKDAVLLNGREKMAVRVLNMNMELLRASSDHLSGDFWLPNSGLIYAFREDAVREDEIVRPRRTTWNNCNENSDYESGTSCRMSINGDAYSSEDPPLNANNLISPKAVDYYGDPDRRPHGFRLMKGQKINRTSNARGISFVSDNPVYIQGDFNLHQTTTCDGTDSCRLEEFTTKLNDETFSNFYTRDTLDDKFATIDGDLWRPAEVLTDAITILSDNFCDGSIVDGWLTAGEENSAAVTNSDEGISTTNDYGCQGNGDRTSFLNFMRPSSSSSWHHEKPWDSDSPIAVSRHGNPIRSDGADYTNNYYNTDSVSQAWAAIDAQSTRVNAVMISGVVPMRANQSYGGLHNFPRFISAWRSSSGSQQALNISGAFFQLNFSNYATGPFDQDAGEPSQNPSSRTRIPYYYPPKRLWGYDVGLQYAQAGPIAQRFVSPSALRSEFYSEPPASDPYINNLCRAMAKAEGDDPDVICPDSRLMS